MHSTNGHITLVQPGSMELIKSTQTNFMWKEHFLQNQTRFSSELNDVKWSQSHVSTKHSSVLILSGEEKDNQGIYSGKTLKNVMTKS